MSIKSILPAPSRLSNRSLPAQAGSKGRILPAPILFANCILPAPDPFEVLLLLFLFRHLPVECHYGAKSACHPSLCARPAPFGTVSASRSQGPTAAD